VITRFWLGERPIYFTFMSCVVMFRWTWRALRKLCLQWYATVSVECCVCTTAQRGTLQTMPNLSLELSARTCRTVSTSVIHAPQSKQLISASVISLPLRLVDSKRIAWTISSWSGDPACLLHNKHQAWLFTKRHPHCKPSWPWKPDRGTLSQQLAVQGGVFRLQSLLSPLTQARS
jgi:hypothetical protein